MSTRGGGGGKLVCVFTSSADVLVSFPGKRRDISDKLIVNVKNNSTATLKVGNWTVQLSQVTIDYQNQDFYVSKGNARGPVHINCDDLSRSERNELQSIFRSFAAKASTKTSTSTVQPEINHTKPAAEVINEASLTPQPSSTDIDIQKLVESRDSAVMANRICRGAEAISGLMVSAAQRGAGQLDKKSEELKKQPVVPYTYRPVLVRNENKKFVKAIRFASGVAAIVATGFVHGASSFVSFVGTTSGPILKTAVANTLSASAIQRNDHNTRRAVEDLFNVAGGVLSSAGHVLKGVEESVKILGPSAMKYARERVGRQYGPDMGEITEDLLGAVGNLATIGYCSSFYVEQALLKGVSNANSHDKIDKPMLKRKREDS